MGNVTTGLREFYPIRSHQRDEVRRWKSKFSSNSFERCKVISIKISKAKAKCVITWFTFPKRHLTMSREALSRAITITFQSRMLISSRQVIKGNQSISFEGCFTLGAGGGMEKLKRLVLINIKIDLSVD